MTRIIQAWDYSVLGFFRTVIILVWVYSELELFGIGFIQDWILVFVTGIIQNWDYSWLGFSMFRTVSYVETALCFKWKKRFCRTTFNCFSKLGRLSHYFSICQSPLRPLPWSISTSIASSEAASLNINQDIVRTYLWLNKVGVGPVTEF